METKKCIVLFSGGLDSRLAIKIMQEQGFKIKAIYFKLPFGCSCHDDVKEFLKKQKVKLKIFDCTKGKLLKEYLEIIKQGKHGRGKGVNPCVDCKIFIHSKAKKYADSKKINLIVNGDVLGERPMSQMEKSTKTIEEKSGLTGRLLRPLSAKKFPPTEAEKSGLINREKLYSIHGRKRDEQIILAKKFGISFPHPAGGCILCEKYLKKKFEFLLKRGLKKSELPLVNIGRHFKLENQWIILGRNKSENNILKKHKKNGKLIEPKIPGPSALIIGKNQKEILETTQKIMTAYSQKDLSKRKYFDKWRL